MLDNEHKYKNFFCESGDYSSYLERLAMDGTWFGELELRALCDLYEVNLYVYFV